MNAKERVIATIEHKIPDRVPVGEWGIDHDHVEKIIGHPTFWRNRKATTMALWQNRRDEVVESLKHDCVALTDALDYDIVTVELVPPKSHFTTDVPKQTSDGVWQDRSGTIYKYAASNDSIIAYPNREPIETLSDEDVEKALKNVENMDSSVFELIDYISEHYGDKKAILCRSIDIYSILMDVFGGDYTHNLILTMDSPKEIAKMVEVCLLYNQKIIDYCAQKNVLIQMQGQDFGMNTGCIMSPDSIRQIYLPVIRAVNQAIVSSGMIPFFHCCGNIWDILDDFVDAGYKGYQSIQESARMDTASVKARYGRQLTLWTGIQCETLIKGSAEDAIAEVRKNLDICMPGGGYIFGSTNTVQYGAKTDNYLKALDTVRKYGVYR